MVEGLPLAVLGQRNLERDCGNRVGGGILYQQVWFEGDGGGHRWRKLYDR